MTDIYLHGSDDVQRGGFAAKEGGESMQRAANQIEETFTRFQMFMTDWLERFEQAAEKFQSPLAIEQPQPERI